MCAGMSAVMMDFASTVKLTLSPLKVFNSAMKKGKRWVFQQEM